jgi:hypothetical protein
MRGAQKSILVLNNATLLRTAFRLRDDKAYILVLYILPIFYPPFSGFVERFTGLATLHPSPTKMIDKL